ncbi:hypothetical protein JCM11251_004615 [Rhodosporidiobolus azoricus]
MLSLWRLSCAIALLCVRTIAAPALPQVGVAVDSVDNKIHLSTRYYTCSYDSIVYGRAAPFRVDVVQFPYDVTDPNGQVVLATVAEQAASGRVPWVPKVAKGQLVALRATDSEGAVGYSWNYEVDVADKANANCRCVSSGLFAKPMQNWSLIINLSELLGRSTGEAQDRAGPEILISFLVPAALAVLGVLLVGCWLIKKCRQRFSELKQRRHQAEPVNVVTLKDMHLATTHPPDPSKAVLADSSRSSSSVHRVPSIYATANGAGAMGGRPDSRQFGSVSSMASTLV